MTVPELEDWVREYESRELSARLRDRGPIGKRTLLCVANTLDEAADEIATITARLAEAEALVKEAREHDPDMYWLSRVWHERAGEVVK